MVSMLFIRLHLGQSETAYGKNVNLGKDEENPMPSGFSFVIEDRRGGGVDD